MLKIGCHLSSSAGYLAMGKDATKIGANTFAFFTRNPRGGSAKAINEADVARFTEYSEENGIFPLVAHSPYTLNPCSAKPELRVFAKNTMQDDLARMEYTPGNFYNFHPGSHTGQGYDAGILQCAEMLNEILPFSATTTVLIETMAGKGSEIGKTFEEIAEIIEKTENKARVGVCLDTCHVNDGGYDVTNNFYGILEEFDKIIGIDRLKAIHLNDSKNPLGAHKDRHEKIGEGHLTLDGIVSVITHPVVSKLPIVLETPNDLDGYAREIALLKEKVLEI